MKKAEIAVCLLLLVPGAAVAIDDAAVQRCRGILDAAARLACYDALPLGAGAPVTVAPAAPGAAAPAAAAPAAVPGSGAAAPAAASATTKVQQFGIDKPDPEQLQAIESTIPGNFQGWYPGTVIRLANGQAWQVTDSTRRLFDLKDPKVTIRRGTFGSYFLEIEGYKVSPRVQRVQ